MRVSVFRLTGILLVLFILLAIAALMVGNGLPDYVEFNYVSPDFYHDIPVLSDSSRNLNLSLRLPCVSHPTINEDRTVIACAVDQDITSVTVQFMNIAVDERIQLRLDLITGETFVVSKPAVDMQYRLTTRAYFINSSIGSESIRYIYSLEGDGYIYVYLNENGLSDVAIRGCIKGICTRYTLDNLKTVGS